MHVSQFTSRNVNDLIRGSHNPILNYHELENMHKVSILRFCSNNHFYLNPAYQNFFVFNNLGEITHFILKQLNSDDYTLIDVSSVYMNSKMEHLGKYPLDKKYKFHVLKAKDGSPSFDVAELRAYCRKDCSALDEKFERFISRWKEGRLRTNQETGIRILTKRNWEFFLRAQGVIRVHDI